MGETPPGLEPGPPELQVRTAYTLMLPFAHGVDSMIFPDRIALVSRFETFVTILLQKPVFQLSVVYCV